jgi:hypothetical protein
MKAKQGCNQERAHLDGTTCKAGVVAEHAAVNDHA